MILQIIGGVAGGIILAYLAIQFWYVFLIVLGICVILGVFGSIWGSVYEKIKAHCSDAMTAIIMMSGVVILILIIFSELLDVNLF
jgi:hypothetical protein